MRPPAARDLAEAHMEHALRAVHGKPEEIYGRRKMTRFLLTGQLTSIALALVGRAGSRLTAALAMPVGRDTLLRLVRAVPEPEPARPTVIGVDDFALRKGHVYGTVIINMETDQPIDVLPERDAETLASWLYEHPAIEIITRDRAGAYADGCRTGAPDATQVADRRHLWKTLGEAVDKTVAAHRACLSEPPDEPGATGQTGEADSPAVATEPLIEYPLVRRHRERHAAIHDLLAQGRSQVSIARELGVCARTVQRFAAVTIGQRIARAENRAGSLDRFKPYLHQRWNDGIHNPSTLHRELAALGWNGGVRTVNRYVAQLRAQAGPLSSAPATPKPPQGHRLDHVRLGPPDRRRLSAARRHPRPLPRTGGRAPPRRSFANMIQNLGGERLPQWIAAVRADGLPALHSFAAGLTRD